MRVFIDCEFDGHNGKLMSIAAVTLFGDEIYIICEDHVPTDSWVEKNVLPHLQSHNCNNTHFVPENKVGGLLREWLRHFAPRIDILADSLVDVERFCRALRTSDTGRYYPNGFKHLYFRVHNVEVYPTTIPGAIQHNAWWDARALAAKLHTEGLI